MRPHCGANGAKDIASSPIAGFRRREPGSHRVARVLEDPGGGSGWREGGSFKSQVAWLRPLGEMKLHCEVEVVSRHLPALGLRNRGKGPRARAFLLISTLKDKRGTRYEVLSLAFFSGAETRVALGPRAPGCSLGKSPPLGS
ncbi:hypothetical protein P7K49_018021 [Saguinus oedipus]|uniref:PIF1/LRR1 pleckstrin homology domain-containing protein n=1 Tax=Saguinus oedipus TaxID=9490 RepID=A0ABQ9V4D2_SAGOE|nr:hypothetical protein P7K49_018021 [Saguinus oedipus]